MMKTNKCRKHNILMLFSYQEIIDSTMGILTHTQNVQRYGSANVVELTSSAACEQRFDLILKLEF